MIDATWLKKITANDGLMGMGHCQTKEDDNLGFGWVYYGLTRVYRPRHVLCIGSHRGFVPMMFAKALNDNAQGGQVTFIDPSLVDPFWSDADQVSAWFAEHDLTNITHHRVTTQDFAGSAAYKALPAVDFLFVDGFHSAEQAEFDHLAFTEKLTPNGLVFFHDSVSALRSGLYGKEHSYNFSVYKYLDKLKADPAYQVIDFPLSDGLSLVRQNIDVGKERQPIQMYPDQN